VQVYSEDANDLCRKIEKVDVAYFDPPYNQHPYGSNYFMLNLICDYREPAEISRVSGIPTSWNRSAYNKQPLAKRALLDAVKSCPASFILISYNTFRGSRNLKNRDTYVTEFLYLVDKR
jgi:adenine-specific DNA-methyltransferase